MLHAVLTAAPNEAGTNLLLIAVVVVVLSWLASLVLHPFTFCTSCGGSPRRFGAVATRSWRNCGACGGTGRRLRVGARMFARNRE